VVRTSDKAWIDRSLAPPRTIGEHAEVIGSHTELSAGLSRRRDSQLRRQLMRILALGAACLTVWMLAHTFSLGLFELSLVATAQAQSVPTSLEQGGTDAAMRVSRNAWTVGIVGGQLSGTYMTFASELAEVLDDGDNLRVLPIVTYGAASNLDDLLYLSNVDVAVTQADVFDYFRTTRKIPNLESRVNYIVRLPVSEMHVLARNETKTIEDLRGKKVSFGPAGSASSLTGTIVFQRLGIQVEQVLYDNPTALQKLKTGELAALVRVIGKPIDFFAKISANSGLRFVPIPFSNIFADYYALGELTNKEYPTLVPEDQSVDTIAVPAVLRLSIGRGERIAIGASKGSLSPFSPNGTSSARLHAIQNGETLILRQVFPAGPVGAWPTKSSSVFVRRMRPSCNRQVANLLHFSTTECRYPGA
jgi:TRAP-type uncharacterized transport system substrate-binding protein